MADNLLYTPGTGATVASDDIGGVHYQRIKTSLGADGAAVDLNNAAGIPDVLTDAREVGTLAAGVGPGFQRDFVDTLTALNDTVVMNTEGVGGVFFEISGTWVGTIAFQYSVDGTTWITSKTIVALATDYWQDASAITANGRFRHLFVAGLRKVRLLMSAFTSGTATVNINGSQQVVGLKGIDIGPSPHTFGYAPASVTATFTAAQTSITLGPTVSATQKVAVTSIQIQAYGTTAGTCIIYFGTGAYTRGTSRAIFDGEFAPSATSKPGFAQSFNGPGAPIGALDEEMKITSVGAISLTVTIWYYLVGT